MWEKSLFGCIANSGLLQYPDKNLYNAAKLLTPEERPTGPVRIDNKMHIWKVKPTAEATVDHLKNTTFVRSDTEAYKDLHQLAGILAHEAQHLRDGENGGEFNAYSQQERVLNRLGYGNKGYMEGLRIRKLGHRDRERAQAKK